MISYSTALRAADTWELALELMPGNPRKWVKLRNCWLVGSVGEVDVEELFPCRKDIHLQNSEIDFCSSNFQYSFRRLCYLGLGGVVFLSAREGREGLHFDCPRFQSTRDSSWSFFHTHLRQEMTISQASMHQPSQINVSSSWPSMPPHPWWTTSAPMANVTLGISKNLDANFTLLGMIPFWKPSAIWAKCSFAWCLNLSHESD